MDRKKQCQRGYKMSSNGTCIPIRKDRHRGALTSLGNHIKDTYNIIQGYLERLEIMDDDINFVDEVSRLSQTSYNEAVNNLARYSQDSGAFDVQYSPYGLPGVIGEILNATKYFEVLDKNSPNKGVISYL